MMFVDVDLLRMGAQFSTSAGHIARNGASVFASAAWSPGVFGDFEAAQQFHQQVAQIHADHYVGMKRHSANLDALAEKVEFAASAFVSTDGETASGIEAASQRLKF
jgi:hypothetical protein